MNPSAKVGIIGKVAARGCVKAKRSWEYGAASEALLELYNPELSVFWPVPFPNGQLPLSGPDIPCLVYAKRFIETDSHILIDGDGSVGDPAALGVYAQLIGCSNHEYSNACLRQAKAVLSAPRSSEGAISHREEYVALWADFVYMAPPFLAYHAVATDDVAMMKEAIQQCLLYSNILRVGPIEHGHGAWRHIVGPKLEDLGCWATGNAWAAGGMVRVLATIQKWNRSKDWREEQDMLSRSIFGILEAAAKADSKGDPPLICNFFDNAAWFGDAASTAMLAAVTYRMAIIAPSLCRASHIKFAEVSRKAVMAHVDQSDGRISPTPFGGLPGWTVNEASIEGSSQGHSFVVMMYSAHRDWLNS